MGLVLVVYNINTFIIPSHSFYSCKCIFSFMYIHLLYTPLSLTRMTNLHVACAG